VDEPSSDGRRGVLVWRLHSNESSVTYRIERAAVADTGMMDGIVALVASATMPSSC